MSTATDAQAPPTERADLARHFNYTPCDEAAFRSVGLRRFLQYRDLGLRAATEGLMRAEYIRANGPNDSTTGWHCHELDLQIVYVTKGSVKVLTDDGQAVLLRAGDCLHQPAFYRHDEVEFSPDYELIHITAPAEIKTIVGRETSPEPRPQRPGRVSEFSVDYDRPEAYKVGDGPRRFLAYRDVGVTAATGRRVNINIVRNSKAGDQSTGWHWHSLACQFVYVLQGWSRVEVEGQPGEFMLRAGDAMTIPRGLKHDVTGFSADFTVFELNIPADYDTVACEPPANRG